MAIASQEVSTEAGSIACMVNPDIMARKAGIEQIF